MNKGYIIPFFGFTLLAAVVLSSLLFVAHPVVWNPMYRTVMEDNYKSRGAKGMLLDNLLSDASAISGGLWTDVPYEDISSHLKYRNMKKKEIAHFEDVRSLLKTAKWTALLCLIISITGCWLIGFRKVWNAGTASFILFGAIAAIWMLIHWHSLFRALHWVIFIDDSWILPNGCYSLLLFPHKVWKVAGGIIAAYVLCIFLLGYIARIFSRSKH